MGWLGLWWVVMGIDLVRWVVVWVGLGWVLGSLSSYLLYVFFFGI